MRRSRATLSIAISALAGPAFADWEVIGAAYKCDPQTRTFALLATRETSAEPGRTNAPPGFAALKEGTTAVVCPIEPRGVQFRITVFPPAGVGMGAGSGSVLVNALSVGNQQVISDRELGPASEASDLGLSRVEVRYKGNQVRLLQCLEPAALEPQPNAERCSSQVVR